MRFIKTPPEELIKSQLGKNYLERLSQASRDKDRFDGIYLPVLERYCAFVQAAPLDRLVYPEAYGALNFGASAALIALQTTDGVIFTPDASPRDRMAMEPLYRFATFCATMATCYLWMAQAVKITSVSGDQTWRPASWTGIYEWASSHGDEYCCSIESLEQQPCNEIGVILAGGFFFHKQFEYWEPKVLLELSRAINPALKQSPTESFMARIVRMSCEKVKALYAAEVLKRVSERDSIPTWQAASQQPTDSSHQTQRNITEKNSLPIETASTRSNVLQEPARDEIAGVSKSSAISTIGNSSRELEQSEKAERIANMMTEIEEWARALCASKFKSEIILNPQKETVFISKRGLDFGTVRAQERFSRLLGCGLHLSKDDKGAEFSRPLFLILKEGLLAR